MTDFDKAIKVLEETLDKVANADITSDTDALEAFSAILSDFIEAELDRRKGLASPRELAALALVLATKIRLGGCKDWGMALLSATTQIRENVDTDATDANTDVDNVERSLAEAMRKAGIK